MKKVYLLLFIFLVACSTDITQITETQIPAKIIQTNTQEIPPTITLSPELLFPYIVYKFPEWMQNINTPVLVALLENQYTDSRKLAFFNAETGEEFDLEMPENTNGYFWYDAQNFGLLSKDLKIAYKLNLLTGEVSSQELSRESIRLLNPDWHHGLKIMPNKNGEFTFDDAWNLENSKDKNFTAEKKSDWDGIIITDNITNRVIWELTTSKGVYVTEFLWSPVDNNILAYVQGKPNYPADFISKEMSLNIVDVTTGKIQATYSGDFGRMKWSPNGKMLLYQNARSNYSNYGIGFQEDPCIIFLNFEDRKCLRSITKYLPTGYELASTGVYQWEMDNESIFYTYLYWSTENEKYEGDLCRYSLVDSDINCITEDLQDLDSRSVIFYSLSPSKEYIYICISDGNILSDASDTSTDGVMKIDGTGYFSWESIIQDGGPIVCTHDELWRPLP